MCHLLNPHKRPTNPLTLIVLVPRLLLRAQIQCSLECMLIASGSKDNKRIFASIALPRSPIINEAHDEQSCGVIVHRREQSNFLFHANRHLPGRIPPCVCLRIPRRMVDVNNPRRESGRYSGDILCLIAGRITDLEIEEEISYLFSEVTGCTARLLSSPARLNSGNPQLSSQRASNLASGLICLKR